MPGGSQKRCTGSFVFSIVCRAPNGGLTDLNFSAAHGVMGVFSGCWANGSDGSQLLSLMPSGPWKSGSQMPDKSGIAADACGVFVPGEPCPDWAGKLREKPSAATIAAIKTTARVRIFRDLPTSRVYISISLRARATTHRHRLPYSDRVGSGWPLTTVFRMNVIVLVIPIG